MILNIDRWVLLEPLGYHLLVGDEVSLFFKFFDI
jgi:hypothetical protein